MTPRYRTWAPNLVSHTNSVHGKFAISNTCQTDIFLFVSKLLCFLSSAFPRGKHIFHTLSHYIQNFLHIALSFCAATRVFLALSLTSDGIQEVMSSSSDRLDSDKLLPSKYWEQKASPVLTKPKGGKVQKGHARQLLLDWNEQSRVESNLASNCIWHSVIDFFFFFFPTLVLPQEVYKLNKLQVCSI